jgi:probable rRNA maturation factor
MLNAKRPARKQLEQLITLAAETAGVGDCPAVSVVFLSAEQMAEVNMETLGHVGPTDVISFDLRDPDLPAEEDSPGIELYICPEVAAFEAEKRSLPYAREVTLYIVHGFLHMAGEDDLNPAAKRKMRRAEKRVIQKMEQKINFERVFGAGLVPLR